MDSAIKELLGFIKTGLQSVRIKAVSTVLSLTGTEEGRMLLLQSEIPTVLCRLVGDISGSAENAVKSLVNLSADGELMQGMLKEGMVSKLMESLRDSDCTWKRYVVMLLANLSQTDEGCIQLMQMNDAACPVKGLHLRRLIQYLVAPVPVPAGCRYSQTGDTDADWDAFEYGGDILSNATRLDEARRILLEPERRILPVVFPQLTSPSVVRRRGAASTLRNCCFDKSDVTVRYMLSPSVDIVTALLGPMVGPDTGEYEAEDREFMNAALFKNSSSRARESDPFVRRQLLESLLLLSGTRMGRDHLRRVRAYPIVRSFHKWMEGVVNDGTAGTGGGDFVGSPDPDDASEPGLHPDDEAGIEAVNRLVQQLFREDEYVWPSAAATKPRAAPSEEAGAGLSPSGISGTLTAAGTLAPGNPGPQRVPRDETLMEGMAGKADAERVAAQASSERRMQRFAVVPAAQARAAAHTVATGQGHIDAIGEDELGPGGLPTRVPDWTEDDPVLPPAFQAQPAAPATATGTASLSAVSQ